jgi:hypothetical protein
VAVAAVAEIETVMVVDQEREATMVVDSPAKKEKDLPLQKMVLEIAVLQKEDRAVADQIQNLAQEEVKKKLLVEKVNAEADFFKLI